MPYQTLLAACGYCDLMFTSNPQRVPCYPLRKYVDATRLPPRDITRLFPTATKEPVCKPCFELINEVRTAAGLPPNQPLAGAWEAEDVG
jgi:hypothetical protein